MKIVNRNAYHEYQMLERFEAGIQLSGPEVKSIKDGRINLSAAFAKIVGGEVFLINADIPLYRFARIEDYKPKRSRKLLLSKREIISLQNKIKQKKLTLVPLACYNKHSLIKVELALAKAKKAPDKREDIKKRDLQKEVARDLKESF